MSLYRMLFGENHLSKFIIASLDVNKEYFGRYRDAFVTNGEIAVYTRNGGGHRRHNNEFTLSAGEHCNCPGCIIKYRLPKHPLYLRDMDDEFDSTYATVYFKLPEEHKDVLLAIDIGEFDPSKRWKDRLANLTDKDFEAFRPVLEQILKSKGKGGIILI